MTMNIYQQIQEFAILAPPFLFAITCHEVAHGWVADRLGDNTARLHGRLTLNPLPHLDPLGVIFFLVAKIGWAKPVPVNAANLKNPREDMLYVAMAGPGANIILAVLSSLLVRILLPMIQVIPFVIAEPLLKMAVASVWINMVLAVFNSLPIPPLDGSKILMRFLPPRLAASYARLERFGLILFILLAATGLLSKIIMPIVNLGNRILF